MEWNMTTCQSSIAESELPELQQKAVDLLDILQKNLPDKTGKKGKWNFEKAHSILHKVCEIVLWGNSDHTSCQAPEAILMYVLICSRYIHVNAKDIPAVQRLYVCQVLSLQSAKEEPPFLQPEG